ncbi:MAG: hypothetical protein P1U30_01435 [Phycisphaerales bacterium]|nr:hypothetical protein [Phycisphaerales bacterium]
MNAIGNLLITIYEFLGTLWVLAGLAIRSRFNFSNSYWAWRMHTAFPQGKPELGQPGKYHSAYEYARWAFRIRRLR